MVNRVILVGNAGKDAEAKSVGGSEMASFSLATSRKWKDKDGEKHEETEWHNVLCWGALAGVASKYVTKGNRVYVEGRIQTRSWDDKTSGEKKYRTEIVAERLQLLGGGNDSKPKPAAADDDIHF